MTGSPTKATIDMVKAVPSVASQAGGRVFPVVAPQGAAKPYLTVTQLAADDGLGLSAGNGMTDARMLITTMAATFKEAEEITLAIKAAAMHHRATSGGVTAEMLVDGPDIADWVEAQNAFRRACQVRVVLTGAQP